MATRKPKEDPSYSIRVQVKKDGEYKKFAAIVIELRSTIDIKKGKEEAAALHATRSSRTLWEKVASPKVIWDAQVRDMSARSRLAEMRLQLTSHASILEEAIKSIRNYLNTQYYEELSNYSTVETKRNMIDRVLKSALKLKAEWQEAMDMYDVIIKDIDQSGFGIRNAVEVLKILDGSKGSRNI